MWSRQRAFIMCSPSPSRAHFLDLLLVAEDRLCRLDLDRWSARSAPYITLVTHQKLRIAPQLTWKGIGRVCCALSRKPQF